MNISDQNHKPGLFISLIPLLIMVLLLIIGYGVFRIGFIAPARRRKVKMRDGIPSQRITCSAELGPIQYKLPPPGKVHGQLPGIIVHAVNGIVFALNNEHEVLAIGHIAVQPKGDRFMGAEISGKSVQGNPALSGVLS